MALGPPQHGAQPFGGSCRLCYACACQIVVKASLTACFRNSVKPCNSTLRSSCSCCFLFFQQISHLNVEVCWHASWCPLCVRFCTVTYSVIIYKCLGSSCGCKFPMCEALDHVFAWDLCVVCVLHTQTGQHLWSWWLILFFRHFSANLLKSMIQLWKGSCKTEKISINMDEKSSSWMILWQLQHCYFRQMTVNHNLPFNISLMIIIIDLIWRHL